jgi:diguanylate cyclase (GGDEF)-like protein
MCPIIASAPIPEAGMEVYLVGLDEPGQAVSRSAAEAWQLRVHSAAGLSAIPQPTHDLQTALLITSDGYCLSHPEEAGALFEMPFCRRAVICSESASVERLMQAFGDECEAMIRPGVASLRIRIGDWLSIERLTAESRLLSHQISEIAAILSSSSQDVTELKKKITFLDSQRHKLSGVLETVNLLSKLSREINCLDINEIIGACVTKVALLVNARYASLYMHNYAGRTLELRRQNHSRRIEKVVRITKDSRSAMCMALAQRKVLMIPDFEEFERLHGVRVERPEADKYGSKSCILAPMLAGDKVVALLNLTEKRSRAYFDESHDLPSIEQMSIVVGSAMRNWQLYEEVKQQAKTDAMTGFLNHQTLFEQMEKEVLRLRRYRGSLSLLMLDIDNFKMINDVYGHQLGDHILVEVARIIRLNIRDSDIPARYGGDEFAVILAEADIERARLVAERIREMVAEETFSYEDKKLRVSLSIGASQYRAGQSLTECVCLADKALYEAKARGRNRVEAITSP